MKLSDEQFAKEVAFAKKEKMKNRFKFYTGKEYDYENQKATKEIISEFKKFKARVREIIESYKHIGASDTQSREEIINYFKNNLEEKE